MLKVIKQVWRNLDRRRRRHFYGLFCLMLVASCLETLSVSAVLPFIGIISSPELIFTHALTQGLVKALDITDPNELLFPITLGFTLLVLINGIIRILLVWLSIRISYASGADLSINIFRRTLYQPYSVHCNRNSSGVINGIVVKTNAVTQSLIATMTLMSSIIISIFLIGAVIFINPFVALTSILSIALLYTIIINITRDRLRKNSYVGAQESTNLIKILQEGLGGIRDTTINGTQELYCGLYRRADIALREAQSGNEIIVTTPRFVIETLSIIMISALAYSISLQPSGSPEVIAIIGTLALAAQRLLPVIQQIYAGWSTLRGNEKSLTDAIEFLCQPVPEINPKNIFDAPDFKHGIEMNGVWFRYQNKSPYILREINLSIRKGLKIGVMGKTGGGKSTLVDLLMGLLEPTKGVLKVDGRTINATCRQWWQSQIAHVPQTIFLTDASVIENIALGIPPDEIDYDRIREASKRAQLDCEIETWPDKYETTVGERGVRLSGGQRQRIGIARALYRRASVIVLDEATSALDDETERSVMDVVYNLSGQLTIFIVSHRINTLARCDQLIQLEKGQIKYVSTSAYQEL